MKRVVFAVLFLFGASSCASSCDSCKKPSESETTPTTDAAALPQPTNPTTEVPTVAPKPSPSPPAMEPNYSCRLISRAITEKACGCPQRNKMGCCLFGTPPITQGTAGPTPYVSCSAGKTDWPAEVEARICKVATDEKKDLLAGCLAAKERLQCGKTEKGDLGVLVPYQCETLLKEALAAK